MYSKRKMTATKTMTTASDRSSQSGRSSIDDIATAVEQVLERRWLLTAWELKFVLSLSGNKRRRLSKKQTEILAELVEKAERARRWG